MERERGRVSMFMPSPIQRYGGGAERTMMTIAAGLARRGLDVEFVVEHANENCWGLMPGDVNLRVLGSGRFTGLPKFSRYVRRRKPDAVLAALRPGIETTLLAKKFSPGLRVVARIDTPFEREHVEANGMKRRLGLATVERLLPGADAVVALGARMAEDIERYAPGSRVEVIPNPVDVDRLVSDSRGPEEHPWFARSSATPVIVSVGRLVPVKDLWTLLEAFWQLLAVREARLYVIGDGPELAALRGESDRLGLGDYVEFAGHVANPMPYIAGADQLVLSSRFEGFGNVIIEAMACGATVVSTDCPVGPAEILDRGRLGYLAPVGDAGALSEAMAVALDAPIFGDDLRAAAQRYSLDTVIGRYERVLGLSRRGRSGARGAGRCPS